MKKTLPKVDVVANENVSAAHSEYRAKRDFEILHNDYHCVIKAGDAIDNVPTIYLENLKTEGVI